MKLRELMTPQVRTCTPDTTLSEVAALMAQLNIGAVPVASGGQVQGMITDRDIVLRSVAQGQNPREVRAAQCMTQPVVTATPDMDARAAADLMANRQIRRLPVVENGQLAGIVALGDLATVSIHEDEAAQALSEISEPSQPQARTQASPQAH